MFKPLLIRSVSGRETGCVRTHSCLIRFKLSFKSIRATWPSQLMMTLAPRPLPNEERGKATKRGKLFFNANDHQSVCPRS